MHRGDDRGRPFRLDRHPALLHHAEVAAEQCLGGRRAQANDDARTNQRDLLLEPRTTRANLARTGCLVDAPLRLGVARPFEMLDRVRDIDLVAIDAGRLEGPVEQAA